MTESDSIEELNNPLYQISKIYKEWARLYPDRLLPGETAVKNPEIIIPLKNMRKEQTPIQNRIEDMITYNKRYWDMINLGFNLGYNQKKYYSDGIPIDWFNIYESNKQYISRCEDSGRMFPGIEIIIFNKSKN